MKIGVVIPSWSEDRATIVAESLKAYDYPGLLTRIVVSGSHKTEQRWGCVKAMAEGAKQIGNDVDILVFCHDDIDVYEDWTSMLSVIFETRPRAGMVGFHGAKGLGSDDIYRSRYRLDQLARYNPMSNMVDAEVHGKRVTVPCEVATIDGFFMAIRREAYDAVGGWEAALYDGIVYHMYDSWMAMTLREHGYSTYLAPIGCKHFGGKTEVGMAEEYEKWAKENGFENSAAVHTEGHKAFYERFRGQLPVRIR